MNDTKLYRKYTTYVAEMTKPENFPTHSAMYYYLPHKQFTNKTTKRESIYYALPLYYIIIIIVLLSFAGNNILHKVHYNGRRMKHST